MRTRSNELKGTIFNIQKFSITDGAGIRTLIFMKGCPLRCKWCSNPESMEKTVQIMDVKSNCRKCGKCVTFCKVGAIIPGTFDIDRNKCDLCGICAEHCFSEAKKIVGKRMNVSECLEIIKRDVVFYNNSGGGITVGGGEPLAQADFVAELLRRCKELLIHTAIETCGYGKWESIEKVFSYTDQIFFDLKTLDSESHIKYTGVDNKIILENAKKVVDLGKETTFRIPIIPGYTDSKRDLLRIGSFIKSISKGKQNVKVEVLPYHNYGRDKYKWLGMRYSLESAIPLCEDDMIEYRKTLSSIGLDTIGE